MADRPLKRRFTAEIRKNRLTHACINEMSSHPSTRYDLPALRSKSRHETLDSCDAELAPAASIPPLHQSASTSSLELASLQEELRQLKDAIEQMKLQIAALHHDGAPPAPWEKATGELDAVVQATEEATQNILEAAETIDTLLHDVPNDGRPTPLCDGIAEQITRIFEACNFQDITGQRITKVVSAMKFIESKIERMIEILGGQDALKDVEPLMEEQADADAKLLEGPQLDPENTISQNDIDRFFD